MNTRADLYAALCIIFGAIFGFMQGGAHLALAYAIFALAAVCHHRS